MIIRAIKIVFMIKYGVCVIISIKRHFLIDLYDKINSIEETRFNTLIGVIISQDCDQGKFKEEPV